MFIALIVVGVLLTFSILTFLSFAVFKAKEAPSSSVQAAESKDANTTNEEKKEKKRKMKKEKKEKKEKEEEKKKKKKSRKKGKKGKEKGKTKVKEISSPVAKQSARQAAKLTSANGHSAASGNLPLILTGKIWNTEEMRDALDSDFTNSGLASGGLPWIVDQSQGGQSIGFQATGIQSRITSGQSRPSVGSSQGGQSIGFQATGIQAAGFQGLATSGLSASHYAASSRQPRRNNQRNLASVSEANAMHGSVIPSAGAGVSARTVGGGVGAYGTVSGFTANSAIPAGPAFVAASGFAAHSMRGIALSSASVGGFGSQSLVTSTLPGANVFQSCQASISLWRRIELKGVRVERIELLGQGAFAEVYKGRVFDVDCAIKKYRSTASDAQKVGFCFVLPFCLVVVPFSLSLSSLIPHLSSLISHFSFFFLRVFFCSPPPPPPLPHPTARSSARDSAHCVARPSMHASDLGLDSESFADDYRALCGGPQGFLLGQD